MLGEENKTIARQYYAEAHDTGDVDLADRLLASDYVHHDPLPGFSPDREGTKQSLARLHAAFPDLAPSRIWFPKGTGSRSAGRFGARI